MPDSTLSSDLAVIRQSRIYFGHHSVGNNILSGVFELASASTGQAIQIHPLSDTASLSEHFFTDAYIGENTRPDTKCSAFARSLAAFGARMPEVALMKFCFVDFGQGMNAQEIFSLYQSTIDSLKQQYPEVTFVHVTAPLTARGKGVKAFVKKLIGRSDNFESDNAERNSFNALLLERYKDEPIFDLARIESTRPDGTREIFRLNGAMYYAMAPEYTEDGGHLNELGQERAGRELIRTLAQTIRVHRKIMHTGLPKN